MMKTKNLPIVCLALLVMLNPVKPAHAADAAAWTGAGFCSLIYTPVKTAFALLMGITGGLSMIATVPAGDTSASAQIVRWGIYGDWLIRPDHLRGQSPIRFVGTGNRARFVQNRQAPEPRDDSESLADIAKATAGDPFDFAR